MEFPDELRFAGEKCVGYQAVRGLAKKLGWKEDSKDPEWFWLAGPQSFDKFRAKNRVSLFQKLDRVVNRVSFSRITMKNWETEPEDAIGCLPSFVLPADLPKLELQLRQLKRVYMVKPLQGVGGAGLQLVNSCKDLDRKQAAVAQQYLCNPLLIKGRKVDLKLYLLADYSKRLTLLLCDHGIAQVCAEPYQAPAKDNLRRLTVHATCRTINSSHKDYFLRDQIGELSNRMPLQVLWQHLAEQGHDVDSVRASILDMAVNRMASFAPFIKETVAGIPGLRCFEFLTMDVILDQGLVPYLLQLNCQPSFSTNQVKYTPKGTEKIVSIADQFVKVNVLNGISFACLSDDRKAGFRVKDNFKNYKVVYVEPEKPTTLFERAQSHYRRLQGVRSKGNLSAGQFSQFKRLLLQLDPSGQNLVNNQVDIIFKEVMRGKPNERNMELLDFIEGVQRVALYCYRAEDRQRVEKVLAWMEKLECKEEKDDQPPRMKEKQQQPERKQQPGFKGKDGRSEKENGEKQAAKQ